MSQSQSQSQSQSISISDHFTVGRLLRFAAPTALMMVFTSVYVIVDGLFVSNFAGKTPFAALNLIFPFLQILGTVGFMVGTGGSALVAKTLGEGDERRANGIFSLLVYVTIAVGTVLAVVGFVSMNAVAGLFGAEGELRELCVVYGSICACSLPAFMLQNAFQAFFTAASKPKVGLAVMVSAGLVNVVLDALFIVGFGWGLAGAAAATAIGEYVGGIVPIVYFARKGNNSVLRLGRPLLDWRALGKTCVNGSSEFMTNIAMSVVAMAYNFQLMRMLGEDGVSAYGIIGYTAFVIAAVLIGFSMASAPIVSYHHGARNHAELRGVLRRSLGIVACANALLTGVAFLLAEPIASLFVGYDLSLHDLTVHALRLYALSFLLMGFNMFGSAFFTALNNGLVSAAIAFLRTLVFETGCVLVLPLLFGVDAIWLSIVVAEVLALAVTASFVFGLRKTYGYW